jgi:hypothetical protein
MNTDVKFMLDCQDICNIRIRNAKGFLSALKLGNKDGIVLQSLRKCGEMAMEISNQLFLSELANL